MNLWLVLISMLNKTRSSSSSVTSFVAVGDIQQNMCLFRTRRRRRRRRTFKRGLLKKERRRCSLWQIAQSDTEVSFAKIPHLLRMRERERKSLWHPAYFGLLWIQKWLLVVGKWAKNQRATTTTCDPVSELTLSISQLNERTKKDRKRMKIDWDLARETKESDSPLSLSSSLAHTHTQDLMKFKIFKWFLAASSSSLGSSSSSSSQYGANYGYIWSLLPEPISKVVVVVVARWIRPHTRHREKKYRL